MKRLWANELPRSLSHFLLSCLQRDASADERTLPCWMETGGSGGERGSGAAVWEMIVLVCIGILLREQANHEISILTK